MASLAAATAAKASLEARFAGQPWFIGVSIAQRKCIGDAEPFEPTVNINDRSAMSRVPKTWMGMPVQVGIWPAEAIALRGLGAAPAMSTQDYANVALGFIAFLATFMVGKIAVNAVIDARKERFENKGQPPEAVKAKESTLDGIMKVAGTGYAIYSIMHDFPEVVAEAKKAFGP